MTTLFISSQTQVRPTDRPLQLGPRAAPVSRFAVARPPKSKMRVMGRIATSIADRSMPHAP
jgi:hypothetical protein